MLTFFAFIGIIYCIALVLTIIYVILIAYMPEKRYFEDAPVAQVHEMFTGDF